MLTSEDFIAHLTSPIVVFLLLLVITQLIYMQVFKNVTPTLASGSIVMALGVFALYVLRNLNFPYSMMLYVTLEILIIGLYIGLILTQAILDDEIQLKETSDELALGTWVVGIVFIILLLNQIEHTLLGFIALLSIIGFSLTTYYFIILGRWYWIYFKKQTQLQVNGLILLITVSLQSIAILLATLFQDSISNYIFQAIIFAGLLFYVLGIFCLFHYLFVSRSKHFAVSWSNENAINYGALSVTGLAMIVTNAFPDYMVIITWYLTLIIFILSESLDLIRLMLRFSKKDFYQAVCIYHSSHWMRLFALGVFYAFNSFYLEYNYSINPIAKFIVDYGQYVIACLLLFEMIILIQYIKQKEFST